MEINIEKQIIDEAVQKAVEEITQNGIIVPYGMTNGELLLALFDGLIIHDNPAMRKYTIPMTYEFWNAPYNYK